MEPKARKRLPIFREETRKMVEDFLYRDDNSRMMAGKQDVKKTTEGMKQKRVLCDYLTNLHEKFCEENPHNKISRAKFCDLRPTEVTLVSFSGNLTILFNQQCGEFVEMCECQTGSVIK